MYMYSSLHTADGNVLTMIKGAPPLFQWQNLYSRIALLQNYNIIKR